MKQKQRRKHPIRIALGVLFPLTKTAWLLLVTSILVQDFIVAQHDDLFLGAGITFLHFIGGCLWALTWFAFWRVRKKVRSSQFHASRHKITCGENVSISCLDGNFRCYPWAEVKTESGRPKFFRSMTRSNIQSDQILLKFNRRGRYSDFEVNFCVGDIFGLFLIKFTHNLACELKVTPKSARLEVNALRLPSDGAENEQPAGSPNGDPVEMRQYAPGDPHRLILWKAFAKTRKLMVRTPERAEADEHATALVLLSNEDDNEAAEVASFLLQNQSHRVLFAARGVNDVAFDSQTSLDLLIHSGTAESYELDALIVMLKTQYAKYCRRIVLIASAHDPRLDGDISHFESELGADVHTILCTSQTSAQTSTFFEKWGLLASERDQSAYAAVHAQILHLRNQSRSFEVTNSVTGRRWLAKDWM